MVDKISNTTIFHRFGSVFVLHRYFAAVLLLCGASIRYIMYSNRLVAVYSALSMIMIATEETVHK